MTWTTRHSRATASAVGVIAFALTIALAQPTRDRMVDLKDHPDMVVASVPSPDRLRLLSLGWHEAVADVLWLNALSFFAEGYRVRTKSDDWLDPYVEGLLGLDPRYRVVYYWAGTVVMYGHRITNETVMLSNRILERGTERFPQDWILHSMLGVNYWSELIPENDEQRRAWRTKGARHFSIAASLPHAPPHLLLTGFGSIDRSGIGVSFDATLRSGYLLSGDKEVHSVRRSVDRVASLPDSARLHGLRRLHAEPLLDGEWRGLPARFTSVLHPEPAQLVPPEDIVPQSFAFTR